MKSTGSCGSWIFCRGKRFIRRTRLMVLDAESVPRAWKDMPLHEVKLNHSGSPPSRLSSGHERIRATNPVRFSYPPAIVLALLLTGFVLLQLLLPLRTAIQIGGDEVFELAKATVFLNGYKPYTEVWNGQPPLHTFLV